MSLSPSNIAMIILLVSFILAVSSFWPNAKGAPFVPTRLKKVRTMLSLANVRPGELVYDLGCGDGRIIVMAARKFGARSVGIEISFLRFLWCQMLITILGLRRKVKVQLGDLFNKDLSKADVVVCFLLQSTNDRLEEKLITELPPKTRIVSNTFLFHRLPMIAADFDQGVYVYAIGTKEKKEGEGEKVLPQEKL